MTELTGRQLTIRREGKNTPATQEAIDKLQLIQQAYSKLQAMIMSHKGPARWKAEEIHNTLLDGVKDITNQYKGLF